MLLLNYTLLFFLFFLNTASHNSLINFTLLDCWVGMRYELSSLWVWSPLPHGGNKHLSCLSGIALQTLKTFFFLSCVFVLKFVKSKLVVHQLTSFWWLTCSIFDEIWCFRNHYFDLWANLAWLMWVMTWKAWSIVTCQVYWKVRENNLTQIGVSTSYHTFISLS